MNKDVVDGFSLDLDLDWGDEMGDLMVPDLPTPEVTEFDWGPHEEYDPYVAPCQ